MRIDRRRVLLAAVAVAALVAVFFVARRPSPGADGTSVPDGMTPPQPNSPPLARRPGEATAAALPRDGSDLHRASPSPARETPVPSGLPIRTLTVVDADTGLSLTSEVAVEVRRAMREGGRGSVALVSAPGRFIDASASTFVAMGPSEATSATAVVPVRRTIDVVVRATDARGDPVERIGVTVIGLSRSTPQPVLTDARGRAVVTSVFHPRERFFVVAQSDETKHGRVERQLAGTWTPSIEVDVAVEEGDDDLPFEDSLETDNDQPSVLPPTALRVTVVRSDGSPAHAAQVRIGSAVGTTDSAGVVRLSVLRMEALPVALVDPALVPVTSIVDTRAGGSVDVVLREPRSASLDVVVTFPDGRPVPFALLDVRTPSGMPPLDVVDGVLRMDRYTNFDGRRSFTHVEPATVQVQANWAARSATIEVVLAPGLRGTARIVLESTGAPQR